MPRTRHHLQRWSHDIDPTIEDLIHLGYFRLDEDDILRVTLPGLALFGTMHRLLANYARQLNDELSGHGVLPDETMERLVWDPVKRCSEFWDALLSEPS